MDLKITLQQAAGIALAIADPKKRPDFSINHFS
jgi:hypothetical protein